MKSSRASQTSSDNDLEDPTGKAAAGTTGKLSRTEALLDTGAGWIDRLIDGVRDRPMGALAIAAAALSLLALVPRE